MYFSWQPRTDGEDYVLSDDVNTLADGVIEGIEKAENAQNSSNNAIQKAAEAYSLAQEAKEEALLSGVQSDWNEENTVALSHIKNRPFYSIPADGVLVTEQKLSKTIPESQWLAINEDGTLTGGIETGDIYINDPNFGEYKYFMVVWDGVEYKIENKGTALSYINLNFTEVNTNTEIVVSISKPDWTNDHILYVFQDKPKAMPGKAILLEIIPATGALEEQIKQLDTKYIPDYISKTEVTGMVGDIDAALDSIIAMQNKLIGGGA